MDWLRLGRLVACLVLAGMATGCSILDPRVVQLTTEPGVEFTIRGANGLVPTKTDSEHATEILGERLRLIGVGNFSMSAGDDITVTVPSTSDLAKVRAVFLRTGVVAFGALAADAILPAVGTTFTVTAPLWDGDQVEQASAGTDESGAKTVTIVLTPAGATAFAAYTAAHLNQAVVITIDGVVVAAPIIRVPSPDGRVVISFVEPLLLSTDVLVAILVSGPLPEAWRQP